MNIAQATTSGTRIGRRADWELAAGLCQRNNDKYISGIEARMTRSAARFIYPVFSEKG
jgi:hypothetical protein